MTETTVCMKCKRDLSLRELAVTNASQDLLAVVKDVRELYLLDSISHPLFIALASRANEVLARIYGRQWSNEEGATVEQQRKWIEENGFQVLDKRARHKEQKLLVEKVYDKIFSLQASS